MRNPFADCGPASPRCRVKKAAEVFIARYERQFPSAVRSFTDDLPASLVHLQLPAAHRKFVSTTNLIDRSFEEERRGTKTIPRFFDEHSALTLVFGALTRATARCQRIRITDVEQHQITHSRQQLGLEPTPQPPEGKQEPKPERRCVRGSLIAFTAPQRHDPHGFYCLFGGIMVGRWILRATATDKV